MSISNNYIPEKINDFNTYLDGNKMIGVGQVLTATPATGGSAP